MTICSSALFLWVLLRQGFIFSIHTVLFLNIFFIMILLSCNFVTSQPFVHWNYNLYTVDAFKYI